MQFKLPELGEGVHEGELVKWLVKSGDQVKFDQPLCEIMTDKATVEIPSAFQGKVAEFHAKEGEVVHVGQLMLSFEGSAAAGASATSASSAPAPTHSASAPAAAKAAAPAVITGLAVQSAGAAMDTHPATRVLAAPSTRRVAREMGVDLTTIQGTGPHGRVMREDLERGGSGARAFASLELLLAHGGNFECRSTIHPALHDETTLRQLAATLAGHGVRHYAWQLLRPGPQLPQPFAPIAAGWPQAGLQQQVVAMFERFELRTG